MFLIFPLQFVTEGIRAGQVGSRGPLVLRRVGGERGELHGLTDPLSGLRGVLERVLVFLVLVFYHVI